MHKFRLVQTGLSVTTTDTCFAQVDGAAGRRHRVLCVRGSVGDAVPATIATVRVTIKTGVTAGTPGTAGMTPAAVDAADQGNHTATYGGGSFSANPTGGTTVFAQDIPVIGSMFSIYFEPGVDAPECAAGAVSAVFLDAGAACTMNLEVLVQE